MTICLVSVAKVRRFAEIYKKMNTEILIIFRFLTICVIKMLSALQIVRRMR